MDEVVAVDDVLYIR